MAFAGDGEDAAVAGDPVVLEITDTSSAAASGAPSLPRPAPVCVSDLARFDPLPSPTVAVRADRHRLIGTSSYFRALLGGSFSESGRAYVQVGCNLEAAVQVLRYLFEPSESFTITPDNFLPLLEGALFLAVESLLVECERWFRTMCSQTSATIVPLDFLIEVWYFAQEHGVTFVQDTCPEYLAQNFAHVISRRLFNKIPYGLLCSTIECPHLMVDSEKQLCEAILYWVSENTKPCERPNPNSVDDHLFLLSKVKICLLPLEFATGTKRHWLDFGNNIVRTILNLLKDSLKTLMDAIADGNLEGYCIRITEYSKNIVLSGCPQITTAFLYISVIPTYLDVSFKRRIVSSYTQVDHQSFILYDELEKAGKTLLFRNVHMVDLSKCPNVHFGAAIDWLKLAFPELRILRALYCLSFQFVDLLYLFLRCPWIDEIDMAIDKSTITPRQSVVYSSSEVLGKLKQNPRKYYISRPSYDRQPNLVFLNISRLTLEGRDDIDDVDLLKISVLKNSLCYINIRNCTLLTDGGISNFLLRCTKIHSMVLSYTSFGNRSIQTLHYMTVNIQELHLSGCKGIDAAPMSLLMGIINITKFLCLRGTSLTDDALCKFFGSSLEYLDVSETAVSMVSLAPVIRRNCNLNCLKTAGCRSLLFEHDKVERISGNKYGDFLQEIGSTCCLEDVEMGWGFCPIQTEDLIPSFSKVRNMTVGLGTTLAENVLHALPVICPFLESLTLRFQVISDRVVRNLLESSVNLQVLCLHYCLGSLTSFSFQAKAPALRILRLQWVTPWITNDDLTILTKNCNLVELSLSGCKLLDSSSQQIIASGWPNLVLLHLEDCGQVTVGGVSSILNCKALEDVLLRHTRHRKEHSRRCYQRVTTTKETGFGSLRCL
ncbi:hypothetical protein GQ55_5G004800 [Panicum hallii var. hallii]|uniref:BACK domain-containing protein n=1 Tax=Panicum hallii var. hallii TaxID=1504633 RepID=A0A2T7DBD2_9POAL|nr:hypothetical protein GQ55_5G004800 [Panicum hallii var. hallii]